MKPKQSRRPSRGVGRVGQASNSLMFGSKDPRVRRNNQAEATDLAFNETLPVDARGQLGVQRLPRLSPSDPDVVAKLIQALIDAGLME